jgi:hypothetical protein
MERRLTHPAWLRAGQKAKKVWVLLTCGRRVELKFPDVQQEGDSVRLRPVEMATAVGYEIELESN